MEIVALGIIAHFVGDYIIQSDWMAKEKTTKWFPALVHGFTYTLPFLLLTQNIWGLLIIALSHAIIDRYRLAKYLIFAKNLVAPKSHRLSWSEVDGTGYSKNNPPWLNTFLLFVADNTMHVVINTAVLLLLV